MATKYNADKSKEYNEGLPAEEQTLKKTLFDVVGPVRGKTVLDIGCGSGKYCALLAGKKARVIGVDASASQIDIARRVNSHGDTRYYVHDAGKMDFLKNASADVELLTFVIPDVASAKNVSRILHEARRVIKKNGRLVVTLLHPFYLLPNTASSADSFDLRTYFKEESRYTATARLCNGEKMQFNETHYSLTEVSRLLLKNNFRIRRIVETPVAPKIGVDKPIYLILEAEPA